MFYLRLFFFLMSWTQDLDRGQREIGQQSLKWARTETNTFQRNAHKKITVINRESLGG